MSNRQRHCGNCGKPLDPRRSLWCSPACANAAWQRDHAAERASNLRKRRAAERMSDADRIRYRITEHEAAIERLRAELATIEGS